MVLVCTLLSLTECLENISKNNSPIDEFEDSSSASSAPKRYRIYLGPEKCIGGPPCIHVDGKKRDKINRKYIESENLPTRKMNKYIEPLLPRTSPPSSKSWIKRDANVDLDSEDTTTKFKMDDPGEKVSISLNNGVDLIFSIQPYDEDQIDPRSIDSDEFLPIVSHSLDDVSNRDEGSISHSEEDSKHVRFDFSVEKQYPDLSYVSENDFEGEFITPARLTSYFTAPKKELRRPIDSTDIPFENKSNDKFVKRNTEFGSKPHENKHFTRSTSTSLKDEWKPIQSYSPYQSERNIIQDTDDSENSVKVTVRKKIIEYEPESQIPENRKLFTSQKPSYELSDSVDEEATGRAIESDSFVPFDSTKEFFEAVFKGSNPFKDIDNDINVEFSEGRNKLQNVVNKNEKGLSRPFRSTTARSRHYKKMPDPILEKYKNNRKSSKIYSHSNRDHSDREIEKKKYTGVHRRSEFSHPKKSSLLQNSNKPKFITSDSSRKKHFDFKGDDYDSYSKVPNKNTKKRPSLSELLSSEFDKENNDQLFHHAPRPTKYHAHPESEKDDNRKNNLHNKPRNRVKSKKPSYSGDFLLNDKFKNNDLFSKLTVNQHSGIKWPVKQSIIDESDLSYMRKLEDIPTLDSDTSSRKNSNRRDSRFKGYKDMSFSDNPVGSPTSIVPHYVKPENPMVHKFSVPVSPSVHHITVPDGTKRIILNPQRPNDAIFNDPPIDLYDRISPSSSVHNSVLSLPNKLSVSSIPSLKSTGKESKSNIVITPLGTMNALKKALIPSQGKQTTRNGFPHFGNIRGSTIINNNVPIPEGGQTIIIGHPIGPTDDDIDSDDDNDDDEDRSKRKTPQVVHQTSSTKNKMKGPELLVVKATKSDSGQENRMINVPQYANYKQLKDILNLVSNLKSFIFIQSFLNALFY